MKKLFPLLIVFLGCITNTKAQETPPEKEAFKYILDYQVPTSPGFQMLDYTPQQVMRGGAAKPIVANLFTNYFQNRKLEPGIAIDFSPYLLFGGGFKNLEEYQNSDSKRMLSNFLISLATIKDPTDSTNTNIGLGARITLFDDHDIFSNSVIGKEAATSIGEALAKNADAALTEIPDEIGPVKKVDLSQSYDNAYRKIRKTKGWASSMGYGLKATARKSYLEKDSLTKPLHRVWINVTRYNIIPDVDLLTILQGKMSEEITPEWIIGIAMASTAKSRNLGAEIVWNFKTEQFDYGANFELKVVDKISAIISIGKRSTLNGIESKSYLNISTSLRANIFGN